MLKALYSGTRKVTFMENVCPSKHGCGLHDVPIKETVGMT